ncbi:MAG: anthranilate synthase component II [Myxococcota bacterium]
MKTILLIDHFDSFSRLLAAELQRVGLEVTVVRSTPDADHLESMARARDGVVLSPGPGRPEDVPPTLELCRRLEGVKPVLGVCLGHQCLAHLAGVQVVRAPRPVHGKAERLQHDESGPFEGLALPLRVGRYHSLGFSESPPGYTVHARADGLVMAMSDLRRKTVGWQFHPESILTPHGQSILRRALSFLEMGR